MKIIDYTMRASLLFVRWTAIIIVSTILTTTNTTASHCDVDAEKTRRNYSNGCDLHYYHRRRSPQGPVLQFQNKIIITAATKPATKTISNSKLVPRKLFDNSISTWISTDAITALMGNTCGKVVVTPRIVEFFVASEGIATISKFWFFGDNSLGTVTNILTIINVLVYFAWQDAISILCTRKTDVSSSSDLAKWRFMYNNFRMPTNMEELAKRPHTILLSSFSHRSWGHLISNMFSLQLVGRYVEEAASSSSSRGRRQFAYFYIASIYASKFIDIFVLKRLLGPKSKEFLRIPSSRTTTTSGNQKNGQWLSRRLSRLVSRILQFTLQIRPGSLGASGAICAVEMLFCLEFPPVFSSFWNNNKTKVTKCNNNHCNIDDRAENDSGDDDECIQEINNESSKNNNNNNNNNNTRRQFHDNINPGLIRRCWVLYSVLDDIFRFDYKKPKNHNIGRCTHLGGYAFGIIFYCMRRLFSSTQVP